MFCEECGEEILEGSKFCVFCGHGRKMVPEESAAEVPVQVPPPPATTEPFGPPEQSIKDESIGQSGGVQETGPPASPTGMMPSEPDEVIGMGSGDVPNRRTLWIALATIVVLAIVVLAIALMFRGGENEDKGTVDIQFIGDEPTANYYNTPGEAHFQVSANFTNMGSRRVDPMKDTEVYAIYHLNDEFYSRTSAYDKIADSTIHDSKGTVKVRFRIETVDLEDGDHVEIYCFVDYRDNTKDDLVFDSYYEDTGTVDLVFIGDVLDVKFFDITGGSYFEVTAYYTNNGTKMVYPETDTAVKAEYWLNEEFVYWTVPSEINADERIWWGLGVVEVKFKIDTSDLVMGDFTEIYCYLFYNDEIEDGIGWRGTLSK